MQKISLPDNFVAKTKRLEIRFFQPKDFNAWRDLWLHLPPPKNSWDMKPRVQRDLTKAKFAALLSAGKKRRKKDTYYDFKGFERKTGAWIGTVSLMDVMRGVFQNAYLGYTVFNPYWSKGYGFEMCSAVIDLGFRELKLHRIEAGIEPRNRRSHALARKLKMRRESFSKRRLFLREKWVDIVCYAITSEERGIRHTGGQLTANRR